MSACLLIYTCVCLYFHIHRSNNASVSEADTKVNDDDDDDDDEDENNNKGTSANAEGEAATVNNLVEGQSLQGKKMATKESLASFQAKTTPNVQKHAHAHSHHPTHKYPIHQPRKE